MKKMTVEERAYIQRVCQLDCCCCGGNGGCAHHPLGGGMGLKAPHMNVIPMCDPCHRDLHMANGRFRTMKKLERRQWESDMTKATKKVLGGDA